MFGKRFGGRLVDSFMGLLRNISRGDLIASRVDDAAKRSGDAKT